TRRRRTKRGLVMPLRPRGPAAAFLTLGITLLVGASLSLAETKTPAPICAGDADANKSAPNQTNVYTIPFDPYRIPSVVSCQANRDLNFLWSANYQTLFGISLPTADIDAFGIAITETYKNPFNCPMSPIQRIHDYQVMRRSFRDSVYAACPAPIGFRVNQPT